MVFAACRKVIFRVSPLRTIRSFLPHSLCGALLVYFHGCFPLSVSGEQGVTEPGLRDEWDEIERIVVSGFFHSEETRRLAFEVIAAAVAAGVEPVIAVRHAHHQREWQSYLERRGMAASRKGVRFLTSFYPSSWARDTAPLVVFDRAGRRPPVVTGLMFGLDDGLAGVEQRIAALAELLGLEEREAPGVDLGFKSYPLTLDGGDWMTAADGRMLVTTEHAYLDTGGIPVPPEIVDRVLRQCFGIEEIVALEPLDRTGQREDGRGYCLENDHIDLQVRTLPGKTQGALVAVVARVPEDDPQAAILDGNAACLVDRGFAVWRVDNASQPAGDSLLFRSYTNALFLNGTLLIPRYGDERYDRAAHRLYEELLDTEYQCEVVPVDAAGASRYYGGPRCMARQIPLLALPDSAGKQ